MLLIKEAKVVEVKIFHSTLDIAASSKNTFLKKSSLSVSHFVQDNYVITTVGCRGAMPCQSKTDFFIQESRRAFKIAYKN